MVFIHEKLPKPFLIEAWKQAGRFPSHFVMSELWLKSGSSFMFGEWKTVKRAFLKNRAPHVNKPAKRSPVKSLTQFNGTMMFCDVSFNCTKMYIFVRSIETQSQDLFRFN